MSEVKERDEIGNKSLKENLANTAITILVEGEDYADLAYTKVEFGYLFDIEGHGLEALFKVVTDKTTAYFAVQGLKMMRLNFNDELFQNTTSEFLKYHKNNV